MTRTVISAVICAAGAALAPTGAHGEETPLSKSCIFATAAQLPAVPGMIIHGASTAPATIIVVGNPDPSMRQIVVTLDIEAVGQTATYEALCAVGNNTPARVVKMTIKESPPPPISSAAQPGPPAAKPACAPGCAPVPPVTAPTAPALPQRGGAALPATPAPAGAKAGK